MSALIVRKKSVHKSGVSVLCVSADGRLLVSGSCEAEEGALVILDAQTLETIATPQPEKNWRVTALSCNAENTLLLSAHSPGGGVKLWDLDSGAQRGQLLDGGYVMGVAFQEGPQKNPQKGKALLCHGGSKILKVDLDSEAPLASAQGQAGQFVCFAPDPKRWINVVDYGTEVHLRQGAKKLRTLEFEKRIKAVAVSAQFVFVALDDGSLVLVPWDMGEQKALTGPGVPGRCASFSADGTRIAVGFSSGQVFVFDVDTGERIAEVTPDETKMREAVALSPTGDKVYFGTWSGEVHAHGVAS